MTTGGGRAKLPDTEPFPPGPPTPALALTASDADVTAGGDLYHRWCASCHGIGAVGGGVLADLRYASPETHERLTDIALGGIYQNRGRPSFAGRVSEAELARIQAYLLARAHAAATP